MSKGIVSARHVDHVGFTVPDLDAAIEFFEKALGADLLWKLGPFHKTPTGVKVNSINLAMLRLGPNINVELMASDADLQQRTMPSNIDYGAAHIAFFVDDIEAAAKSLEEQGAKLLKGPLDAKGYVNRSSESGTSKPLGARSWRYCGVPTTLNTRSRRRIASINHTIPGPCLTDGVTSPRFFWH